MQRPGVITLPQDGGGAAPVTHDHVEIPASHAEPLTGGRIAIVVAGSLVARIAAG
jgi:hypothetical protein